MTQIAHRIKSTFRKQAIRFSSSASSPKTEINFSTNPKMDRLFKNFFSMPKVSADEAEVELVDPQVVLREECQGHCTAMRERYEACNDRVRSKKQTSEICSEEIIDFMHCIDHCVTPKLFAKLK